MQLGTITCTPTDRRAARKTCLLRALLRWYCHRGAPAAAGFPEGAARQRLSPGCPAPWAWCTSPPHARSSGPRTSFQELCLLRRGPPWAGTMVQATLKPEIPAGDQPLCLFWTWAKAAAHGGPGQPKRKDRADLLLQLYPLGPMLDLIAWDAFTLLGRPGPAFLHRPSRGQLRAAAAAVPPSGPTRPALPLGRGLMRGGALEEQEQVILGSEKAGSAGRIISRAPGMSYRAVALLRDPKAFKAAEAFRPLRFRMRCRWVSGSTRRKADRA